MVAGLVMDTLATAALGAAFRKAANTLIPEKKVNKNISLIEHSPNWHNIQKDYVRTTVIK